MKDRLASTTFSSFSLGTDIWNHVVGWVWGKTKLPTFLLLSPHGDETESLEKPWQPGEISQVRDGISQFEYLRTSVKEGVISLTPYYVKMRVLPFSPMVFLVGNTTYGIRAQQWIEYGVIGNFSEVEFIPLRKGKGGEGVSGRGC